MRKRLTYLSIYLSIYLCSLGQTNLVPNPSFEDTVGSNCAFSMHVTDPLFGSSPIYLKNWCTYKYMNPEYYNSCANNFSSIPPPNPASIPNNCEGYQKPHTGYAYVGSTLYLAENLPDTINTYTELEIVKLKQPLKANSCYFGEMYYSFANVNTMSINQLGMLFTQTTNTTTTFVSDNLSKYQIQADTNTFLGDTLNWTKISGQFIAQGGEEFLTIGNIRDGAHLKRHFFTNTFTTSCQFLASNRTVYIYIDDVSLYELPNHTGTQSYTLCAGDSLLLGDTVSLPVRYQWSLNGVVVDTTKNITITNAGTYILQTKHCTTQTQTITVVVDDGCNPTEPTIPNVFTPNRDGINDSFQFSVGSVKSLKFTVYNRWGNIEHVASSIDNVSWITWDGRTTSGEACSSGVYFYVLEYTNANGDVKKKNGYISLIR